MKRLIVISFAAVVFLGVSTSASAQFINNVCWSINGFPLNTALTLAGAAGSTIFFDVDGYGTSTGVPIKGTLTVPPAGDLRLSFLIQAASPSQNAVVHELSLTRTTLNGSGHFRWFDSTNSGTSTAILVPCASTDSLTSQDPVSEGFR